MISKVFVLIVPLALAAGSADQNRQAYTPGSQVISSPKYNTSGQPPSGYTGAPSETPGDQALENQIRQSIYNANLSDAASRVTVSVQNGTATLSGSVASDQDRQTLDSLVRNTSGVNRVMDQLQISPPPGETGQTTYNQSQQNTTQNTTQYSQNPQNTADMDRSLIDRVQQALKNDNNTAGFASNIGVSAQNGAITLTGSVPGDQERRDVENVVRNVNGVSSIFDRLQIASLPTGRASQPPYNYNNQQFGNYANNQQQPSTMATGDIFNLHVQGLNDTDRNLAQGILEGLRTDTLLASLMPNVTINVSGGRVILQGTVQSEQQKQTIASVVQRAAGASNVENQLQVAGQ